MSAVASGTPFGSVPGPNASRYASPNLSFQILPISIDGMTQQSSSKTHFRSISCNDDGIYLGTDNGEIVIVRRPLADENDKTIRASVRVRRKIRSSDAPVEQLACLRTATQSYIVALCAKTITIHRSADLELLMTVPLVGASCFAVNEGVPFPGLAVAESSTLYLYNLQFGFDMCKPFALPEQPVSMAWMKDFVCVAYRDEYSLVSDVNGSVHELAYTDGAAPLCRTLPMEEILVVTKNGALITQPQGWKVSAFKLSSPIRSIAFSFPYIFSLSSKGSECSIEIRSVMDVAYHEVLRLPSSINGKHHVCLADDQLNVFILDNHQLHCLTPNTNAHSTAAITAVSSSASQRTSSDTSSSSSPHSKLSSSTSKVSSKNSAHTSENHNSRSSDQTKSESLPLGTTQTPTKSLRSASESPSPALSVNEAGTLSDASTPSSSSPYPPYHIPAPTANDKNGFIRYIRTIMRQEHNPYRLLLHAYAEKIVGEFPNPATARIEDVKKCVATYLRRFLRTFSLEFKQFQSKTMRDLLTVAVSISLHAIIFVPLYSIIQSQSDAQDKNYNAKMALLHSQPFHPSQFEIRPKFWLNSQSILAEEEKETVKRSLATSSDAIAGGDFEKDSKAIVDSDGDATASGSVLASSPMVSSSPMVATTDIAGQPMQDSLLRPQASRASPDPLQTNGDLSTSSLKRYFLGIPAPRASDDGNSSTSTDGEEFAIDFRSPSPSSQLTSTHPGLPKSIEEDGGHFNSALRKPTNQKRQATAFNSPPLSHPPPSTAPIDNDTDRFTLGEAKLYQMASNKKDEGDKDFIGRTKKKSQNSPSQASDFKLLDVVKVSYDSEHHLYFTSTKTHTEKELAPQEWNFTFRDEDRSIYWQSADSTLNRLSFAKKRFYLEFTARYRLYEQTQSQGTASSISLAQSFSQPSFLVGSMSSSSIQMHMGHSPRDRLQSSGSAEIPIDFGSSASSPRNPSASGHHPSASGMEGSNGPKMESPTARQAETRRPVDLRRLALEHSATASSTPTKLISPSGMSGMSGESPRSAEGATPIHSAPSSPSMRTPGSPSTHDYPYCAAIRTLRLVPRARTPREKIETMARALSYVAQAVDDFWAPHGKKVIVGADDLVPIFSYVVAMARVPNMYSEMSYTMEFSNESSLRGKYGYSIATLQICVEHVIQVSAQIEGELNTQNSAANLSASPTSIKDDSPSSPVHSTGSIDANVSPGSSKSNSSPIGSSKRTKTERQTMRFQDLMGKMQTMSHLAGKLKEAEDTLPSFDGPSPPPGSNRSSQITSPALSPSPSRPTTPSPPHSSHMDDRNAPLVGSSKGHAMTPDPATSHSKPIPRGPSASAGSSPAPTSKNASKLTKFTCSALEVSQPQIDGAMWVQNGTIHFEGTFKKRKRTITLEVSSILALKKSWGLFGGDGIDIYATKDRIIFFRHFTEGRDQAHDIIQAEADALGVKLVPAI